MIFFILIIQLFNFNFRVECHKNTLTLTYYLYYILAGERKHYTTQCGVEKL